MKREVIMKPEAVGTLGRPGPVVIDVAKHLGVLKRRLERLEENLAQQRGSANSLQYDKEEAQAVRAAMSALYYHRATIEGEDTARLALGELLDAVDEMEGDRDSVVVCERIEAAADRARELLKKLEEML